MKGLTPLEKALIRAILKGLDERDKLVKEFRYFTRDDIDRAVDSLIQKGAVESRVKGVIRKKEKLSVTHLGQEMLSGPTSVERGRTGGRSRRSRARSVGGAALGVSRLAAGPALSRLRDDEEEEEEDYEEEELEEEEERKRGFLDAIHDELEEIGERLEDAVEEVEEEVEEFFDDEEEEEE